jgi:chromosome segregation ATPase
MNVDQIVKQVDWLDDERRKDQTRISSLEEHIVSIDGNFTSINSKLKDHSGEINRLGTLIARMDSYDEDLFQLRLEIKGSFDELKKQHTQREETTQKERQSEIRALEVSIAEIRKELEPIPELKRGLTARIEEENRLGRSIDEVRARIETVNRSQEEYTRTVKLLNDGRRQDAKRLTDLHGEVSAIRKRSDDQHGRVELNTANQKKIESRLSEFSILETERREEMDKFLENQALKDVERDRTWKEYQSRFEIIENQTAELGNKLELMDTTRRDIQHTQKTVEDLSQKVERRISEFTEVQRLAEERFRQEWVTFKADDKKRWTNYTLTVDEQHSETLRQFDKVADMVTPIEDELQELKDLTAQMVEQTEKRLGALLSALHESVTGFERTVGRAR